MYNQPPFTVAVKSDSPIKEPKDFIGKKLGGAANDGALKLFPALCRIDQDRLRRRSKSPTCSRTCASRC